MPLHRGILFSRPLSISALSRRNIPSTSPPNKDPHNGGAKHALLSEPSGVTTGVTNSRPRSISVDELLPSGDRARLWQQPKVVFPGDGFGIEVVSKHAGNRTDGTQMHFDAESRPRSPLARSDTISIGTEEECIGIERRRRNKIDGLRGTVEKDRQNLEATVQNNHHNLEATKCLEVVGYNNSDTLYALQTIVDWLEVLHDKVDNFQSVAGKAESTGKSTLATVKKNELGPSAVVESFEVVVVNNNDSLNAMKKALSEVVEWLGCLHRAVVDLEFTVGVLESTRKNTENMAQKNPHDPAAAAAGSEAPAVISDDTRKGIRKDCDVMLQKLKDFDHAVKNLESMVEKSHSMGKNMEDMMPRNPHDLEATSVSLAVAVVNNNAAFKSIREALGAVVEMLDNLHDAVEDLEGTVRDGIV